MFLREVSNAHQHCIYVIKTIVKTVLFVKELVYFLIYFDI